MIVQPIIQQEAVNLNIQNGEDKEFVLKAITEAPLLKHKVNSTTIPVPGKEIIT